MTRTRRTFLAIFALAAGIAFFVGGATRTTWAQAIAQINARVVAVNIPGASAIAQVGTFLSGPPAPFGQCTFTSSDTRVFKRRFHQNRRSAGSKPNPGRQPV